MDAPNEHITRLLDELEGMGSDAEELGYWRSILPDMTDGQKAELAASLDAESIGLKKAAGIPIVPEEEQRLADTSAELERIKHREQADSETARRDAAEEQVSHIKESL